MTDRPCRFCEIIRESVSAHVVFTDADTIAFLDHRPVFQGHTLLVPRAHHETLPDISEDLTDRLFRNARMLCQAVETGMAAEGTFVAINNRVSQSVPHLHVHIIPRRRHDGLRGFLWPRQKYRDHDEMESVAERIRAAVAKIRN